MRSRRWSSEWLKRTWIGAIVGSRVRCPTSDTRSRQHDCRYSAAAGDRASPGAETKNRLEGVSKPSLGTDRGRRLLYRGSVDSARSATIRGAVLHRAVDSK